MRLKSASALLAPISLCYHRRMRFLAIAILAVTGPCALAGPMIQSGDLLLRHDIQSLADAGVITGPTSSWPLAWAPILEDVRDADASALGPHVVDALVRVRERAQWELRSHELFLNAKASVAEEPARLRSFQNTPRETAEFSAGLDYISNRFAVSLSGQIVDSPLDEQDLRADRSMAGFVIGNYSYTINTLERWWGPGWDSSLILSNNARPMPSFSIDRIYTDAFETKWLSWLGPWDLAVHFGQMESDRHVPNTQFFGMRFNFKPVPSLEIGLSRIAQWCGDGRPCDVETFFDLFLGKDNAGDDGIDEENEPGNQLAGLDFRWSFHIGEAPIALYGQFIGDDEAGGLPSRYTGQVGVEGAGLGLERWSYRWYMEAASTSCDFAKSEPLYDCAYNHGIYETGYRYRGRSVAHAGDNDTRLLSVGLMLVDPDETQWSILLRHGELNRARLPDPRNSLTPTPQDIASIDITHSRLFRFGQIDIGLGYEKVADEVTNVSSSDARAFLQWRTGY